jgi:WD40 repeat protein
MAPEQVRGQDPTPQADIYALGVALFEMLTGGERPFTGEQATITGSTSEKVRWEQLQLAPPSPRKWNPGLAPELEELVLKCLSKDPTDRFNSALDLLNALQMVQGAVLEAPVAEPIIVSQAPSEPIAAEQPRAALPEKTPTREVDMKRPPTWAVVGGIAALVLVIGGIGGSVIKRSQDTKTKPVVVALTTGMTETAKSQPTHIQTLSPIVTRTTKKTPTSSPTMVPTLTPTQATGPYVISAVNASEMIELMSLEGHRERVTSLSWSPDSMKLASGSTDNTVRIWDITDGSPIRVIDAHISDVRSVAWSPNGELIASGSNEGNFRIWDAHTGEVIDTLQSPGSPIYSVAWSPDGSRLGAVGARLFKIQDSVGLKTYGGVILLWSASLESELQFIDSYMDSVFNLTWSPDGTILAVAGNKWGDVVPDKWYSYYSERRGHVVQGQDRPVEAEIRIFQTADGQQLQVLKAHYTAWESVYAPIYEQLSVAWSPDSALLASLGPFDTLSVWETTNWETLIRTPGSLSSTGSGASMAWSPDSALLATVFSGVRVQVLDPRSGEILATIEEPTGQVSHVAWSPDGVWLVVANDNGTIRLWGVPFD